MCESINQYCLDILMKLINVLHFPPKIITEPLDCTQSLVYVGTLIMNTVLTRNYEVFALHIFRYIKHNRLCFKEGYKHIFISYLSTYVYKVINCIYDYYYWVDYNDELGPIVLDEF